MKFLLKSIGALSFIALAACLSGPSAANNESSSVVGTQTVSKAHSCFNDLQLSYPLTYDYGNWSYKNIYKTNLLACLPDDSSSGLNHDWQNQEFSELQLPANTDALNDMELHTSTDPYLLLNIYQEKTWSGSSIQQWILEENGGKFTNSDSCLTPKIHDIMKTIADYPAPHYVDIQIPVINLQNANGQAIRFEACKELGVNYALLINGHIYLIGYEHAFDPKNVHGEELLQAILRTIKTSS